MKFRKSVAIMCMFAILCISVIYLSTLAENDPNFTLVMNRSTYAVGDTFEVKLVSKEFSIISIACGISFDPEQLECLSISGADPENPEKIRLRKSESSWVDVFASPTVDEANSIGNVGITLVAVTEQKYSAGEIFSVVFRVKAAGESRITIFEDSDGKDGNVTDNEIYKRIIAYDKSEAENANVYLKADKKTLAIGDQMTVTLSSREMTVGSFVAGIGFDKSKLKCISITGSQPDDPGAVGLTKKDGHHPFVSALIVHTPDEANTTGNVGMTVMSVTDSEYADAVIFTVTFEAIAEGEAIITLFEDSDGTDGYRADNIQLESVIVTKEPNVAVVSKGITEYDPLKRIGYTVEGQRVTVKSPSACRAVYLDGNEYVKLKAEKNPNGTYTYTVPKNQKEIILVLLGDLNYDGMVDSADTAVLGEAIKNGTQYTPEQMLIADINENGKINSADRVLLARSLLDKSHEHYKALDW